jgi:hypothetical protein
MARFINKWTVGTDLDVERLGAKLAVNKLGLGLRLKVELRSFGISIMVIGGT